MTHLIALDIDGTLLGYDESLTQRTRDAVASVQAAGHHVVLATGRSLVSVLPVAQRLGLSNEVVVCSNGSVTAQLQPDGGFQVLDQQTFHPASAIEVVQRELPDALFATEVVGWGFQVSAPFPPNELHGEHEVVDLATMVSRQVTRVVVRSLGETTDDFHAVVERLGLDEVTFAVGWTSWLDIAPKGVTKAFALEQLRQQWQVPLTRTVGIGDGMNDLEMLRWAGTGVAMGHAAAPVHKAADFSTESIGEDGAALVLERLAAGRPLGPVAQP